MAQARTPAVRAPHRMPVGVLVLLRRPDGRIPLTEQAGGIYLAGMWVIPGDNVDAARTSTPSSPEKCAEVAWFPPDEQAVAHGSHDRPVRPWGTTRKIEPPHKPPVIVRRHARPRQPRV
ncbi:hypothetical protein [Micromonospora sp. KC723]|uniref:hypothetical protein n=1 Tax=Micromonospora sp. KC723 TaxID=2530381 RepID=UPI001A9F14D2|nr:hypothetical protein [Micromonospora sp. KC723]